MIEKEAVAKLGPTTVIKKFIGELPDNIKANIQRKFTEYRLANPNGELTNEQIEDLYCRARKLYREKKNNSETVFPVSDNNSNNEVNTVLQKQNDTIQEMQEKLDTFIINKNTQKRNTNSGTCHYCKKPGHLIKDCRTRQAAERRADQLENDLRRRRSMRRNEENGYCAITPDQQAAVTIKRETQ